MSGASKSLAQELLPLTGRKFCLTAGRATAALVAGLRATVKTGKVLLPAISNPAPSYAVKLAGLEPVFADVRLSDFTISPEAARIAIAETPGIKAIIAIHLFGHPADMTALREIADVNGVLLIEDSAQAFGGSHRDRPHGSFGAFSIVSFGHSKIPDAGRGGVLLTDDEGIASRAAEELRRMPARPTSWESDMERQRLLYYELKASAAADPTAATRLQNLPTEFRSNYLFRSDAESEAAVLKLLPGLQAEIAHRRRLARLYAEKLANLPILRPAPEDGAAWWRYCALVPARERPRLLDGLRSAGFDASSWYPSLASGPTFPNAARVEGEVVNLWTAPGTSEERASRTAACFAALMEKSHA